MTLKQKETIELTTEESKTWNDFENIIDQIFHNCRDDQIEEITRVIINAICDLKDYIIE